MEKEIIEIAELISNKIEERHGVKGNVNKIKDTIMVMACFSPDMFYELLYNHNSIYYDACADAEFDMMNMEG